MLGTDVYRRRIEIRRRSGNDAGSALVDMSLLRRTTAVLVVPLVLFGGVATCRSLATADPPSPAPRSVDVPGTRTVELAAPSVPEERGDVGDGVLGTAGGRLPDGATAADDGLPGVARLDPDLRRALLRATADAADDGVAITLTSGWRSRAYQAHLLDEAVATHGSRAEAARWVATPETSPHVTGDAVDVDGNRAATWLAEHGAAYGLCRVYANEPWHVELRPQAPDHGCPARYADPTHDPRMHR